MVFMACLSKKYLTLLRYTALHIQCRLELSFADTLSELPVLKDVKEMLQGIWKHYHYSAKAVRELKELAERMEVRAYKVHICCCYASVT